MGHWVVLLFSSLLRALVCPDTSANGNGRPLHFSSWVDIVCYNWVWSHVFGLHHCPRLCMPIYTSVIICGIDSGAFTYIDPISASTAIVTTTLIIWDMFNTSPLFLGVLSFPDLKNTLPFLPWDCWVKMHLYDMPVSCHLHGTWLSHLGAKPHNLGIFHFLHCWVSWICLFWWYCAECYQHCDINCSCIIKERYCHLLENCFFGFIQLRRLIFWFHLLLPCAVFWCYVLVRLIFWFFWF